MPSVQLNSGAPGGETRDGGDVSGIGLGEQISRFLEAQGVDVERSLANVRYEREDAGQRAQAAVRSSEHIALALRKARRALAYEERGYLDGSPGFNIGKRNEAQERVSALDAALSEALCHDPELIAEAKRLAAR